MLPFTYVVNTWVGKGAFAGLLERSDAYHHTWTRVGTFDLPAGLTVVSASAGKPQARSLRLSNHQLLKQ